MNNSKEAARMRRSIKKLSACGGDCKHCEHAKISTAGNDRFVYYAYYCDVDSNIQPYSNTLRDLRQETLDALAYELE